MGLSKGGEGVIVSYCYRNGVLKNCITFVVKKNCNIVMTLSFRICCFIHILQKNTDDDDVVLSCLCDVS